MGLFLNPPGGRLLKKSKPSESICTMTFMLLMLRTLQSHFHSSVTRGYFLSFQNWIIDLISMAAVNWHITLLCMDLFPSAICASFFFFLNVKVILLSVCSPCGQIFLSVPSNLMPFVKLNKSSGFSCCRYKTKETEPLPHSM